MSHLDWVASVVAFLLIVIAGGVWDVNKKLDRLQGLAARPKNPDGTDEVLEVLRRIEHDLELVDMRLRDATGRR